MHNEKRNFGDVSRVLYHFTCPDYYNDHYQSLLYNTLLSLGYSYKINILIYWMIYNHVIKQK